MKNYKADDLVNTAVINLFTLGKETNELNLFNFNRRDPRHLALIHITSLVKDIAGYKVSVHGSFITYLWIKWKFRKLKGIGNTKKATVDMEDFIKHIEDAYEAPNAFSHIYRDYYSFNDR